MGAVFRRARIRTIVVTLSAAVLVSGVGVPDDLLIPAASAAVMDTPEPEPIEGRELKPEVPAKGAEDRADTPKAKRPVWPSAGKAEATLADKSVQVGDLPVRLAKATGNAGGAGPGGEAARVSVETLPQDSVKKLGGTGLAVRIARVDGGDQPARTQVKLDYSAFRYAHGGGWADRLRVIRMPACALAAAASCDRDGEEVPAVNDVKAGTITLDTDAASAGTLLTLAAAAAGPTAGNFTATDLRPQSTWNVGLTSGSFSYSVPIGSPPSIAGGGLGLGLRYDSSRADGLTKVTNNQASWVGEGWDMAVGYVERRYRSCSSDAAAGKNPNQSGWGDLCWESPEENDGDPATNDATASDLFINLGGQASRLVKTSAGYKTEQDFGWKIELLTGGDQGAEYWKITTQVGLVYRLGYRADSLWRVPFVGDDAGEPCRSSYNTSGQYANTCSGIWRWNLDQAIDPRENVTDYFWTKEQNNYTHGLLNLLYDRGGYLDRVEWGTNTQVPGSRHISKVVFNSTSRALGLDSDIPDDLTCSPAPGGGPVTCSFPTSSPTFFISARLSSAVSYTWNAAAGDWENIAETSLTHKYVYSEGDSPTPVLWLDEIKTRGLIGDDANAISMPAQTFGAVMLSNRVDVGRMPDGEFNDTVRWPRIGIIGNGFGAQVRVTYAHLNPCVTGYQATRIAWDRNTSDCYPVFDGRDMFSRPSFAVYRKHLVTKVTEQDLVGGSPDMVTNYEYVGTPAWAKEINYNTRPDNLSWGDFRGYGLVRTIKGTGTDPEGFSVTSTAFFRGLYDDVYADGTKKQVTLTDFDGNTVNDQRTLSGQTLESRSWRFTTPDPLGTPPAQRGMQEVTSSRTTYWQHVTANGPGIYDPIIVKPSTEESREVTADGSFRRSASATTYDNTTGLVTKFVDRGDLGDADDDTCSTTTYARNTTQWMIDFPSVQEKRVGADCTGTLLSRQVTLYDSGSDPATNTPSDGNITESRSWTDANTVATAKTTYDKYGRSLVTTDALGKTTTLTYNPPTNWPVNGITTTNTLGHTATTWKSPLHGGTIGVRDTSGRDTNIDYDALGRTTTVWTPAQPRTGTIPAAKFSYQLTGTTPARTTSEKLLTVIGGQPTWSVSHSFQDGLGRQRESQTESPSGGRIVSVTTYDARGNVAASSGPAYNSADPGTGLLNPALTSLPQWSKPIYDGVGRTVAAVDMSGSSELRRTTTNYLGADVYEVVPPLGGKTVYHTDVDDQVTKIEEWLNADGQAAAVQGPGLSPDKSGSAEKSADSSGPAGSEAAAAAVADPAVGVEAMRAASQAAVKQGKRVLAEGATTESSLTYANADGKTFTTELSAGPVRVRQGNAWVAVDTTLVAAGGVLKPKAALAEVEFSAGGAGVFARMTRPDKSVFALEWPGVLPKPQVKGNVATYVDAAGPGADLVVTALSAGFRHDVVLRTRPAAGVEYRLPVQAEGLNLRASEAGLALVDAAGKTAASAPKPVMWDASVAGGRRGKVGKIDTRVVEENGRQVLVLRPDAAFLADPATRYPVTVDPTTTLPVVSDTWISSYGVDGAGQQAGDWLWVGTYNNVGSLGVERAYLMFNTAAIAGANVSSATLTLQRKASDGCGDSASGIRVQRITAAWNPGTITWANKPATTTAGEQIARDFATCPTPGLMSWNATAFAQAWASGTANNGLMLRGVDETVSGRPYYDRGFDSNEGAVKPSLSVTYAVGSAPSVALASPAVLPVTTVAGQVTATSLTPQLAVTVSDGTGGPLTGEFEVEHDPSVPAQGSGQIWAGSVTGVATGAVAALTVAPVKLQAGWLVRWRARAVNPGQSTSSEWTAWQSLRVNPAAAPAPVSSPVVHWKLDETSGTVAGDATGAGRSATLGGTASWTPGVLGGAMTATGNPNSAATTGPVMRTDQSFTVSAWLNLEDDSNWYEVFRQMGSVKPAFYLGVNPPNKQLEFVIYNNDTSGAIGYGVWAGTVPLKRWFHLTGVYDRTAGRVYLYLNGQQIGTNTVPLTWNANGTMTLGAVFNGKLDDIRVYQKVLTPTEIAALAAGSPAPDRTPTADQPQVTPSSTTGGVAKVTSLTPTFSARVAEPGGQPVKAEFQVEHDPADTEHGTGTIWAGSQNNIASGSTASLAIPAGTLGDNWGVRWRARAVRGDTVSAWTSWQSFTVDVPKPSVTGPQLTPSQQVEGVTVTSTVTPQLSATVTDPAGQALRAEFEVDHDPNAPESQGTGQIWAGNVPGAASGTQVSVTVPAGELMDGWRTRWRVRAVNPVGESASAWSGWHAFTVDVPKPSIAQLQTVPSAQVGEDTVTPTLTPSLRGTVSEPAAGQVKAEFEIEHDPEVSGEQGSGQIWAGSSPDVASGQVAAVAVPAGELTNGWKVRWRARAVTVATSVASAWSEWQNLTVALPSGGNLGIDLLQVSPSSVVEGVTVTSSATPSLIGRVFDPASGNLRAEYEVEHDPAVPSQGSGQIWAGAVDNVPSGTSASLAVPAGKLADGYKVRWRARVLAGATSSAWSDWQSLSVDVTDPILSQFQVTPAETVEGATVAFSVTPTLHATVTDPNGGTLRGEFELEREGAQIWAGSIDNVASGSDAAVAVPAGKLSDGETARWRVRAVASAATSAWSDWHEFSVAVPKATVMGLQVTPSHTVDDDVITTSLRPALHATLTDPVGGDLRGEFELEHEGAQIWAGSVDNVASGSDAAVTVPGGELSDGMTVRWRARAVATGSTSPWSDWQTFTVELPAPTVDQLGVTPSGSGGSITPSLTPALDARVTGPAGGTLRAEFEVEHDLSVPGQGTGQIWAGGVDDVLSGTLASITVPAGELSDGWKVRWRARAVAVNGTSAWSDWKVLTIQVPEGGPTHYDTTYEYDLNGNLVKHTDANGNVRTFTYDLAGRRLTAQDPDAGSSEQAYDVAGRLLWSIDGNGKKVSNGYDDLSRKTSQWIGDVGTGTKVAEWVYDTLSPGQLTSATRWTGGQAYTTSVVGYDVMNRPTGSTLTIPASEGLLGGNYTFGTTYTAGGAVATTTLPSAGGLAAETLTSSYTDLGLPYGMTSDFGGGFTYVKSTAYTAIGQLFERSYGVNGQVKRTLAWDDTTGRITQVATTSRADTANPTVAQHDHYSYDISGEITRILDDTTDQAECFTYDDLHRLSSAWTTTASACSEGSADGQGVDPYAEAYSYDAIGNLSTRTHNGQIDTYHYPTSGPGSIRPDAVGSISHSQGGNDSYTYDAAGQLATRMAGGKAGTFTWNELGELTKATVDGKDTTMVYGLDGGRLLRRDPDGSTTLYLGSMEIQLSSSGLTGKRYYAGPDGALVAMRTSTQPGVRWMAAAMHGTAQLAIDDTTGAVNRERYLPFGQRRGADDLPFTDLGFLGKIEDESTGLTHIGARYYDPTIAKFISTDPLLDFRKPQWANPFSYAGNNPVGMSDPTGLYMDAGNAAANRTLGEDYDGSGKKITNKKVRAKKKAENRDYNKRQDKRRKDEQQRKIAPPKPKEEEKEEESIWGSIGGWIEDNASTIVSTVAGVAATAGCLALTAGAGSLGCMALGGAVAGWVGYTMDTPAEEQSLLGALGAMTIGAATSVVGGVLVSKAAGAIGRTIGKARSGTGGGRAGGSCPGNSFTPGTRVLMADGSTKPIENIRIGEKVLATDPETGQTASKPVTALIPGEGTKSLVRITITLSGQSGLLSGYTTPGARQDIVNPGTASAASALAGPEEGTTASVVATEGHPIWVPALREWIPAGQLQPRAWIRTSAGIHVQVTAITRWTSPHKSVHNLTIADLHTYYVLAGTTPVLVHNCGSGARDGAGLSEDGLLEAASGLRDEFAESASKLSNSKRPATVTAGYNVETGQYAAGGSFKGACAEMCVVSQLGGDASKIRFTSAVRPRTGDPVDVCMVCEVRYGRSSFVQRGTTFLSDFFARFY
ncbi:DNRLRE domain-containing protein [Acrocarpospora macrocephala]|uniref:DNRLRE domain-containing protein n=1 Tax=Acrocarpospora macrocephala TaxID=150177 RepID=UPI0012D31F5F|nr:DNRLRE domain-containing protein [Acrocarpospora macrocephala]